MSDTDTDLCDGCEDIACRQHGCGFWLGPEHDGWDPVCGHGRGCMMVLSGLRRCGVCNQNWTTAAQSAPPYDAVQNIDHLGKATKETYPVTPSGSIETLSARLRERRIENDHLRAENERLRTVVEEARNIMRDYSAAACSGHGDICGHDDCKQYREVFDRLNGVCNEQCGAGYGVCKCRDIACKLQAAIDTAYTVLLCRADVGGSDSAQERCDKAMCVLNPYQASIG